jgi:hypothetical protein
VKQDALSVFISEGNEAKDPNFNAMKFNEEWDARKSHTPTEDMNQPLSFDAPVKFMQINFLRGFDIALDSRRPT